MMRTEGSLLRKIWKPFDWILLWLEKYWQILIGRWRKESERGRKKVTIEDVIKKSILPLAFMLFWFWMVSTIMKVSGQTDLFWWIFLSGLPFGIHNMRLILIPKGIKRIFFPFGLHCLRFFLKIGHACTWIWHFWLPMYRVCRSY